MTISSTPTPVTKRVIGERLMRTTVSDAPTVRSTGDRGRQAQRTPRIVSGRISGMRSGPSTVQLHLRPETVDRMPWLGVALGVYTTVGSHKYKRRRRKSPYSCAGTRWCIVGRDSRYDTTTRRSASKSPCISMTGIKDLPPCPTPNRLARAIALSVMGPIPVSTSETYHPITIRRNVVHASWDSEPIRCVTVIARACQHRWEKPVPSA